MMIRSRKSFQLILFFSLALSITASTAVQAEEAGLNGAGTIELNGKEIPRQPVDPEDPSKPVDPGPGHWTSGDLRIDFAPNLNLGRNSTAGKNRRFFVNAQLFKDDTPARGNYIQITDQRPGSKGWTLQVRQERQFRNDVIQVDNEKELNGATFSFDYGWANSIMPLEQGPIVKKDIINIESIATTYDVATAEKGKGYGTWTIEFGASATNTNGKPNTLFPKSDENGAPILDPVFNNQQVFENQAIFLSVPDGTKIHPVQYQTELTWILAELPI